MISKNVRWRRALLPALVLLLAGSSSLAGQGVTTAGVTGTVTTSDGQPVTGAQVTATLTTTGISTGSVTDASGRYFIPYLQPGGPYTVAVTSLGYADASREDIQLTLGQTQRFDFVLTVQAVQLQGIEVAAGAEGAIFNPSKTGASTVITEESIEALPTVSRNLNDYVKVSPYVYVTGDAPSIAGQNNRMNNIQIDGAVNNDVFGLADSGVPGGQANAKPISIEAIEQFNVLVAPFDVRQAGFSGGLINAVTKSGTNEFHGSIFGYYRNLDFIREELVVSVPGSGISFPDTLRAADFENQQFGFSLGGPIVRDRAHFFVNGEFERRTVPLTLGIGSDPARIRVAADTLERFMNILQQQYGLNPGDATAYSLDNPLNNVLGKVDVQLTPNHRLTLRHNYAQGTNDDDPSRGGSTFELSSATYLFESKTHSTVLQLHSLLGDTYGNELLFNYERIRDRRTPPSEFLYPSVDVRVRSDLGGSSPVSATLRAGAELFSHANELDQDVIQVTDNLTASFGSHRVTVGAQGEHYKFRNLFAPSTRGAYVFSNLGDFEANDPSQFSIAVPVEGVTDLAARFSVLQLSGYVQDEWTVNDRLMLSLGLRVDLPMVQDDPLRNPEFEQQFGFDNSVIPDKQPMLSPRFGFNWQAAEGPRTQVRGGVGLFTGRPPFVWLSNAFGNTGLSTITLNCPSATAPAFGATAPTQCTDGTTAAAGGTAIINTLDEDFKFPQELKVSLGFDRELPLGITASVEGLYTKSINQIFSEELNLQGPQNITEPGIGNRPIYGRPVAEPFTAFEPVRVSSPDFGQVINLTNTSEPYSYLITGELSRLFFERLNLRGSYTYLRAFDTQSLQSSQATSNIGFNAIAGDINDPPLTRSNFERPHKVVVSASTTILPQFGGTDISLFYVGKSGKAYSYMYDGDVNGDGYETFPTVNNRNNDLVYVPAAMSEVTFDSPDDARLLQELIEQEDCLQESRGGILERNSCRGPWSNQLDMKVVQRINTPGFGNIELQWDVLNVLNLLNEEWGLERGPAFNTVDLLALEGRAGDVVTGPMVFSYDSFTERGADGVLHAVKPYSTFFNSRWQMQLGLRYSF